MSLPSRVPILRYLNKPFEIHVDAASSCGIGGALMQREDLDDPDSLVPIAFWSRKLQDEERGYDVREHISSQNTTTQS